MIKGLPIKKIPDPDQSDLPTRKFPKQKSGLRYTSDLVIANYFKPILITISSNQLVCISKCSKTTVLHFNAN
jgi:hypothetical protein